LSKFAIWIVPGNVSGVPSKGVVAANAIAPSHDASPATAQAARVHLVTQFHRCRLIRPPQYI
jgi:hypothetical protein